MIHLSFTFVNNDKAVVKKTINNLQAKSSSRCDGISSKLLKVIEPVIIAPLTLLIKNQVLNSGIFPDKLKLTKSYQYIRRMTHNYSKITGQSHFFLQFKKY